MNAIKAANIKSVLTFVRRMDEVLAYIIIS